MKLNGGRSYDKLHLVIVADGKAKFNFEGSEPIQSTPGQRLYVQLPVPNNVNNDSSTSACQQTKLVTILLYELRRRRKKVCIMRIDVPLVDTEIYDARYSCKQCYLQPYAHS